MAHKEIDPSSPGIRPARWGQAPPPPPLDDPSVLVCRGEKCSDEANHHEAQGD